MRSPDIAPADLAILIVYLGVMVIAGAAAGRRSDSAEGFLLGKRSLPWWLLLVSIVATETSTVTFLSLPAETLKEGGNCTFLQLTFGYILGRLLVVRFLLPEFFSGDYYTAYGVLQQRFGTGVHRLASVVFLITRNLADGLRLFLAALVLQAALGVDFLTCVAVVAGATAIYAVFGGVSAVVYNDFAQFAVYILGGVVVLALLAARAPGGAEAIVQFGLETGRLHVLDFDWSLTTPSITVWSGVIGGAVLSLATHGADHMMVQRYLCARNQKSAAWALGLSGPVVMLQFALFLAIGVALAHFYATNAVDYDPGQAERAFAAFLTNELPVGLTGLLLAAVMAAAMSTLSSSFNASAGVAVKDLLAPAMPDMSDGASLVAARAFTLVFAAVQGAVALFAYYWGLEQSVIKAVLSIAGFSTGLLLGLYALGLVCGRASSVTGILAFACGLVVSCYAVFGTDLSWPWYTLVGSSLTLAAGWLLNWMQPAVGEQSH